MTASSHNHVGLAKPVLVDDIAVIGESAEEASPRPQASGFSIHDIAVGIEETVVRTYQTG